MTRCQRRKAKIERFPDQAGDVPITFADVGKAKEQLGYDPQVSGLIAPDTVRDERNPPLVHIV